MAFHTVPMIINGEDVHSQTRFDVVGPVENKKASECSAASRDHLKAAVQGAQKAFASWSKTKVVERRDVLLKAAKIMEARKDELKQIIHEEIGADEGYQEFIIGLSIEGLVDTAGRIAGACQGGVPDSIHPGMRAMILKRPYGVNLAIAPW